MGVILGSGLGALTDQVESPRQIHYRDIPGFPAPTVEGHAGTLVAGALAGKLVVALSGRLHMYEGHTPQAAGFPARILHALGAPALIVTNAAGGIRRTFAPGTLMLVRDHINLLFRNPLIGAAELGDARFPDMSEPYDAALCQRCRDVAAAHGIALDEGVYAALLGPSYETAAEVRMLALLGADAVGMSTVPEVLVARAIGMRVMGLSCITNVACGISAAPITHADVIETTARAAERIATLIKGVIERSTP
jgi:purine-nucleoside phosphorylase